MVRKNDFLEKNLYLRVKDSLLVLVKPWSHDWHIAAGAYSGFCSMKRLEAFLLPQDGMLVHPAQVTSPQFVRFPNKSPVPIYTPAGWREAL